MYSTNLQLKTGYPKPKVMKSDLVRFYEGFKSFWLMHLYEDGYIVFKLPSCNLVESAKLDAQKRIDEMGLTDVLETVGTGRMSNTFVVKVKGDTD